jgi:hypothetical protein
MVIQDIFWLGINKLDEGLTELVVSDGTKESSSKSL